MRHDEIVTVEAEFMPDKDQAKRFNKVIKKYNVYLREKEERKCE